MKCIRFAAAVTITLAGALPAAAQRGDPMTFAESNAMVSTNLGVASFDLDPLDAVLRAGGLPGVGNTYGTYGAGGSLRFGRLLLSSTGQVLLGRTQDGTAFDTNLSGGFGRVDLGYTFPLDPRTRVFPEVGLGAGRLGLELQERRRVDFDDVIADPSRDARLTARSFFASIGGGGDRVVEIAGRGVSIGLRGGYAFALGDAEWSRYGGEVGAGPDAGLEGPYLRLSVGVLRRGRTGALVAMATPIVTYAIQ